MDTSEDKIYQGINFTSLKKELTVQKLWRKRTWKEILKHFVTALIFGTLGSFIDIGTDGLTAKSFITGANYTKWVKNLSDPANHDDCVHTGRFTSFNPGPEIEYEEIVCFEQDPIWGWMTVVFIFLPGYITVLLVTDIIMEMQGKTSHTYRALLSSCMILPCVILFPLALILVKFVCLINPGSEWKRLNARITGLEGAWESACQSILTLFIIFTRADRQPSNVQIASLIASFAMLTKAAIADYLSPKQPMELKEELKATANLLPLFLSNGVFKVLSVAITITCLRYIGIAVFLGQMVIFSFSGFNFLRHKASCCPKRLTVLDGGDPDMTSLRLKEDGRATKRQNLESCVFTNLTWGIFHLVVLTSIVSAANSNPDSLNYAVTELDFSNTTGNLEFSTNSSMQNQSEISPSRVQSVHFSRRPGLVENLPLLNGLYVGIVSAMAINAFLFYFQMWKPMVEEEGESRLTTDNQQGDDEEGEQETDVYRMFHVSHFRWKEEMGKRRD